MLACLTLGCNKSPYEFAPVHGTVAIDGVPMSGGRVMFAPIAKEGSMDAGRRAFGEIQADGRYVLGTASSDDGAVVGQHWITVYAPNREGTLPVINRTSTSSAAIPSFSRITVPSGAVEVLAGKDNEIDVRLTSQQIAQYGQK